MKTFKKTNVPAMDKLIEEIETDQPILDSNEQSVNELGKLKLELGKKAKKAQSTTR